ncbi:Glycosyltransferase involved in cell wall bisynthesis [Pricia antarctica]|uniref:Glycosyltransferase involved in cell wall bisynthesis n=1 Tax=Pricia antarctica TaxID=641691 RepID=A0A1G6YSG3_9FLAO|nr:glycosyltransferase family 4 protein [Pricia antarctica]SDD92595.1 Glycosyltransferase involved in cell wall bisynthesis [Pricia antarctica]
MEKKKNIAFFGIKYFPPVGGTSRVAENLIRHLKNNYNITLYCYKNELAKNHIKGVKTIEFPKLSLGSFGVFLYFFICYCHIRLRGNYDIIHAHKIDSFFFLEGLSKKAKVIATAHGVPYKDGVWGGVAKSFFKANEMRFLKFKGIKTAISEPLCDFYKDKYNVDVKYIPNGITLIEHKTKTEIVRFWPENVPSDSPFVLFAGRRIMRIKGLHTMLKAYKKIDYKGHIFVAGDLDFSPSYIKEVKSLSKGLNIHFLGYVNSLPTLLELVNKSEYFVFPSEIEGMSMMLLEVASTGTPILASDIPANTKIFTKSDLLFFKNRNVDDLAEKLLWIENNKLAFKIFGERARTKVATKYTWDKITHEYIALYESA